jgi:hypothetical protein
MPLKIGEKIRKEIVEDNAKSQFSSIPVYAKMTEQDAIDYITTNVTDLASAKVVLIALARMNIALRNRIFSDIEGS